MRRRSETTLAVGFFLPDASGAVRFACLFCPQCDGGIHARGAQRGQPAREKSDADEEDRHTYDHPWVVSGNEWQHFGQPVQQCKRAQQSDHRADERELNSVASVTRATTVKPGFFISWRTASFIIGTIVGG